MWLVINHPWTNMDHIDMVYPKDSTISKRVTRSERLIIVAWFSDNHDIAVQCQWVHCILSMSNVISCIVNAENAMVVYSIVLEDE